MKTINSLFFLFTLFLSVNAYTQSPTHVSLSPSLSNDNTLSSLTVSEGILTPDFDPNTQLYQVSVANNVKSITITATASNSNAIVIGDTGTKDLNVGLNAFAISVNLDAHALVYLIDVIRAGTDSENWIDDAETDWYTANTSASSFTINSAEKLAGLSQLLIDGITFSGKTIILGADLNLAGKRWTPIGTSYDFRGTFDGGEHTISNMDVNVIATNAYGGLFACTAGATVKNLHVNGNVSTGGNYVRSGGIAGYAAGGSIQNCSFNGNISAEGNNTSSAGGIVGQCSKNKLYNNFARGTVKNLGDNNNHSAGGIAGYSDANNDSYLIQNNYFEGTITTSEIGGSAYKGGIVGNNWREVSTISNNYWKDSGTPNAVSGDKPTGVNIKNNIAFTGTGTLASAVNIGGTSHTTLLNALNAWVTLNQTSPKSYLAWGVVASRNDGYPIFGANGTSLPEIKSGSLKLYPNPVSDLLYIDSSMPVESITLYSLLGSVVFHRVNPENTIDVSTLTNGIYFAKITTLEGETIRKIIKE